MNNGEIIALTFLISAMFGVIFHLYFKQRSHRHKSSLPLNWRKFEKSIILNDIKGINHYGDLVLWNEHLDACI